MEFPDKMITFLKEFAAELVLMDDCTILKAMNFKIAAFAVAALVSPAVHAQDAQKILEGARIAASLTKLDEGLTGNINGKTPIVLFLKEKNIQFQFDEGKGWQVFHLRLADSSYDIFEINGGKTVRFPDSKITSPIAGSDLTYEDLSFRFFYWPNPVLEGTEKVAGQDCYKIRVNKPKNQAGRYETVYIWVHTKFGAFMRVRGHDKSGGLLKEFQVEDVMEIGGGVYTLRKMQVATVNPSNGKRTSITNVVFDKPKGGAPKGLQR